MKEEIRKIIYQNSVDDSYSINFENVDNVIDKIVNLKAPPQEEKFKSNYIFELDKIEEENLANYLNKLKKKYSSYGFITYEFTPTGIGTVIKVRSSHKKKAKEITNLDSW